MANIGVSPPPQQNMPDEWAFNPRISSYLQSLERNEYDLWIRTGGEIDRFVAIEARLDVIEAAIVAIEAAIVVIEARLDALEANVFIEITATANHTTTRNEVITCTNTSAITITLNATPNTIPAANEEVNITATASPVAISGNGKTINGSSTITITAGTSRNIIYNSTADAWFIR